jgi:hypothetical protein
MADKSLRLHFFAYWACSFLERSENNQYLNAIAKPRKALRLACMGSIGWTMSTTFSEVKSNTKAISILEFGTNEGYAFRKLLYATKYLGWPIE